MGVDMKRKEFINELNGLDKTALQERAVVLAEELMKLRFKKASKQLEKGHLLTKTRRDLARVKSILASKSS
jgi:large subunit ribosomal protein L29